MSHQAASGAAARVCASSSPRPLPRSPTTPRLPVMMTWQVARRKAPVMLRGGAAMRRRTSRPVLRLGSREVRGCSGRGKHAGVAGAGAGDSLRCVLLVFVFCVHSHTCTVVTARLSPGAGDHLAVMWRTTGRKGAAAQVQPQLTPGCLPPRRLDVVSEQGAARGGARVPAARRDQAPGAPHLPPHLRSAWCQVQRQRAAHGGAAPAVGGGNGGLQVGGCCMPGSAAVLVRVLLASARQLSPVTRLACCPHSLYPPTQPSPLPAQYRCLQLDVQLHTLLQPATRTPC
jgi:hypothetical protein